MANDPTPMTWTKIGEYDSMEKAQRVVRTFSARGYVLPHSRDFNLEPKPGQPLQQIKIKCQGKKDPITGKGTMFVVRTRIRHSNKKD